jgi:hypothetical protein
MLTWINCLSGPVDKTIFGVCIMATNGIDTRVPANVARNPRRFTWLISGLALRLLIAFIISWMIILAFFVSGVVSH